MNIERPLGYWETLCHIFQNQAQVGMVQHIARLSGTLPEDHLRYAVAAAQSRYPMLCARIERQESGFVFCRRAFPDTAARLASLPITVAHRENDTHWRREIEEAAHTPMVSSYPWRVLLLTDGRRHDLIAAFEHAIADATATTLFMQDVLRDIGRIQAGETLDLEPTSMPFPRSGSQVARNTRPQTTGPSAAPVEAPAQVTVDFHQHAPLQTREARQLPLILDEQCTRDLVRVAKAEGATVNAALSTALLQAVYAGKEHLPVPFFTAFSFRPYAEPPLSRDVFGSYAMTAGFTVDWHEAFWPVARACKQKMHDALAKYRQDGFLPARFHVAEVETALQAAMLQADQSTAFTAGAALSNLGMRPFEPRYGDLELHEMYFCTVQTTGGFIMALHTIGVHGKLFNMFSYTEPLLPEAEAVAVTQRFQSALATALAGR